MSKVPEECREEVAARLDRMFSQMVLAGSYQPDHIIKYLFFMRA
ncbi:MAG TPA: hypothetical protein VL978_17445 [Puia sp.]|nr:hypothetical protein [Puia sp.]